MPSRRTSRIEQGEEQVAVAPGPAAAVHLRLLVAHADEAAVGDLRLVLGIERRRDVLGDLAPRHGGRFA